MPKAIQPDVSIATKRLKSWNSSSGPSVTLIWRFGERGSTSRHLGLHCNTVAQWQIGGEKLKNIDDYSSMAEIIVQAAEKRLPII